MKRTPMTLVLFLVLCCALISVSGIGVVKGSGETIYIRADGSVQGTDKIQGDEDLYVLISNISDVHGIVIERDNMTLDGQGYTVGGPEGENGIFVSGRSNVTIRNIEVRGFSNGILLGSSSDSSIIGNNITGSDFAGVYLESSSNNTVTGNSIIANAGAGVNLWYSFGNSVVGNSFVDNGAGVSLGSSGDNNVCGNVFVGDGLYVVDSFGCVVEDNLVNGRPLVYLENVSDWVVQDAGQVILVNSSGVRVENLDLSNATVGVELFRTNDTVVSGNNMTGNKDAAVRVLQSSNDTIVGNSLVDNYFGVWLDSFSSNNSVVGNDVIGNTYAGVRVHSSSNGNVVTGNRLTANGKFGVWLDSGSNNNSVVGNYVVRNTMGIRLDYSSNNNSVVGNLMANNYLGIGSVSSCGNGILSNNVTANEYAGILLSYSSTNNGIVGNTIVDNCYGVKFEYSSSNNSVSGNVFVNDGLYVVESFGSVVEDNSVNGKPLVYLEGVSDRVVEDAGQVVLVNCSGVRVENLDLSNATVGVELLGTNNALISGNSMTGNSYSAVRLHYSSNNTVTENNVANNNIGIGLFNSSGNRIFHNTFADNVYQAFVYGSMDCWDDGYPSGGNYWSDYTGLDSNGDAIGDTPRILEANNTDGYPLMGTFSCFSATAVHSVETVCNSTISGFQFNGSAISFNVAGETGTTGFCRIAVPRALMNDGYRVYVNSTEVQYSLLAGSNSTYSYLYFTYDHSTQKVVIVPELPSLLITLLFMIFAVLVAMVCRKRTFQLHKLEKRCVLDFACPEAVAQ